MTGNQYLLNSARFGTHHLVANLLKGKINILDIGCNDGYLRKLYPRGKFTGIEYSATAAKMAKKNGYQSVRVGDLNNYQQFRITQKFQALVFADVLEHLIDPEKVLSYFIKQNLSRRGFVIVSLPNVAHLTIRLGLLFGNFNYTDSGILDRTHFHLYTTQTAHILLQNAGLKIISSHFSSNRFGFLFKSFPILGPLLGFNLIYLCQKA